VGRPDRGEDSGGFTPKRGRESEIGIAAAPDRPVPWVSAPARRCGSRPALVAARRDHPGDPGGLSGEDGCCVFADPGFGCGVAFFAVGPGGFRGYSRTWMESITIATLATFASVTGHVIGKSRASWVCASVPIRSICWLLLSTRATGCGCGRRSRRGRPRRGCGGDGGGVVSDAGEQPFVRGDGSFGVLAATVSLPVLSDLSWPNSADDRLQHRRKPGSQRSPASLQRSRTRLILRRVAA